MKKVIIIGRPNVGKSTLFNRLTGKRRALVHDLPGVTRDWREGQAKLSNLQFTLVDTAGLEHQKQEELSKEIWEKTKAAVESSQVLMFVIDAQTGVLSIDKDLLRWARKFNKPMILVANKAENPKRNTLESSLNLGLGDPILVSAEHGEGMVELYHALSKHFTEDDLEDEGDVTEDRPQTIRLSIMGRPNVGKSTLLNALLNEERVITGEQAGLTRDSVEVRWTFKGQNYCLVDTAGLRKRAKITEKLEKLSVSDGLISLKYSHVIFLDDPL